MRGRSAMQEVENTVYRMNAHCADTQSWAVRVGILMLLLGVAVAQQVLAATTGDTWFLGRLSASKYVTVTEPSQLERLPPDARTVRLKCAGRVSTKDLESLSSVTHVILEETDFATLKQAGTSAIVVSTVHQVAAMPQLSTLELGPGVDLEKLSREAFEASPLTKIVIADHYLRSRESLQWLAGIKRLKKLSLDSCAVLPAAASVLRELPALTDFTLDVVRPPDNEFGIDASDLVQILAAHPRLTKFVLKHIRVKDFAVIALARLKHLEHLELHGCRFPDGCKYGDLLVHFEKLRIFSSDLEGSGDRNQPILDVVAGVSKSGNLQALRITGCGSLTRATVQAVLNLPKLEVLSLHDLQQWPEELALDTSEIPLAALELCGPFQFRADLCALLGEFPQLKTLAVNDASFAIELDTVSRHGLWQKLEHVDLWRLRDSDAFVHAILPLLSSVRRLRLVNLHERPRQHSAVVKHRLELMELSGCSAEFVDWVVQTFQGGAGRVEIADCEVSSAACERIAQWSPSVTHLSLNGSRVAGIGELRTLLRKCAPLYANLRYMHGVTPEECAALFKEFPKICFVHR